MLFYLTVEFYGFNAGFFLICNVVGVQCDGVKLEFFLPTKVFMFYMFVLIKMSLAYDFSNHFSLLYVCLIYYLGLGKKEGFIRSADARWSFRTPPSARRLGGAAAYRSYLVTSK